MISGKYYRYRNIFHCIFTDICDAIRRAFSRDKKKEELNGYGRWINLEQGGSASSSLPSSSTKKPKEKNE